MALSLSSKNQYHYCIVYEQYNPIILSSSISMQEVSIKLVIVGDSHVGKTNILTSYMQNGLPSQYIPSVFDNAIVTLKIDEHTVNLGFWDTSGQQEYSKLRSLAYHMTQIFLITFSIADRTTLINAVQKWYPQVINASPRAYIVFLGNKTDLRSSQQTMTEEQIKQQLNGIECIYHECSIVDLEGLKQIFENSVKQVLINNKNTAKKLSSNPVWNCRIM